MEHDHSGRRRHHWHAAHGEGSVLVFQYSPNAYTLRHNGRMVRSDLTSIEDICDAIASLANKPVLRAG